jgi:hypothetical protein
MNKLLCSLHVLLVLGGITLILGLSLGFAMPPVAAEALEEIVRKAPSPAAARTALARAQALSNWKVAGALIAIGVCMLATTSVAYHTIGQINRGK